MNKALIIIDAQEDFTYGALRNEDAIAALPVITSAVEFATDNRMSIYYTRDTHSNVEAYLNSQEGRKLQKPHCIYDTHGWDLCREVLPRLFDSAKVIDKYSFGTFEWSRCIELNVVDEIWMCGFCTDICVSANFQIIKAAFSETPIVIIEDACAGTTPGMHEAALEVMASCQARVLTWDNLKQEQGE